MCRSKPISIIRQEDARTLIKSPGRTHQATATMIRCSPARKHSPLRAVVALAALAHATSALSYADVKGSAYNVTYTKRSFVIGGEPTLLSDASLKQMVNEQLATSLRLPTGTPRAPPQ